MDAVVGWGALVFVALILVIGAYRHETQIVVPPSVRLTPLAEIILKYNNQQSVWKLGRTWTNPLKGVVIQEDDATEAQAIADVLESTVPPVAPMSVPLALLGSESDIGYAINGNFLGSNKSHDPLGYDDGPAQEKLRYLIGQPGVTDATSAKAFALDPKRAIPYFWSLYNSHLQTAAQWIATGGASNIDPRLMNRWILAAVIYKQGDTGGRAIFLAGDWPAELNNFVSLEVYFAKQLGTPSVFVSLG